MTRLFLAIATLCIFDLTHAFGAERPWLLNRNRGHRSSRTLQSNCDQLTTTRPKDASQFLQPNYSAWMKIQRGMTYEQTVGILGPPISLARETQQNPKERYYLCFGKLHFADERIPVDYRFTIGFNAETHIVERIQDPFESHFTNGEPGSVPITSPAPNSVIDYYPRIIDFRWSPVSGKYPMKYDVQIQYKQPNKEGSPEWEWYDIKLVTTSIPYLAWNHPAKNPGRFRVRAVNTIGAGEWSDYREFNFK